MKLNRRTLHIQRKQLDTKLKAWKATSKIAQPKTGWLKAIRESMGLSSQQLGEMLKIDSSGVLRMEQREAEQKITLDALSKAAEAMGCKLVYALVPEKSLEHIVDQKAEEAASKIIRSISHSMRLEKQELTPNKNKLQIKDLTLELKSKLDPLLWEKSK